ncbi:MAG: hypothetical protein IK016_06965 [Lachnospiraceae bacterium]|nr:hypothetical protein [Lachnospiraceae bacterium]
MTTYDTTVTMLKELQESDLMKVMAYISRFLLGEKGAAATTAEPFNPYKPLTREEIMERLEVARKHADAGVVMDARKAIDDVRTKYGLR